MNGFLNVFKPTGMSSAAVVGIIKRASGEKKVGHAGTLDPEASGVLPIMLGRATRLFDYLVDKEKIYEAVCEFGTSTDTQDATGNVLAEGNNYPDLNRIMKEKVKLEGDIWQRPSMFSAIKQGGEPLYKRARNGEEVDVPLRQIHVEKIEILGEAENHGVNMRIYCGKGTYIRSICNDLGELTGCPAHMRSLCRVQSGYFKAEDSLTLEQARELAQKGNISSCLVPMDAPIRHIIAADIPSCFEKNVINGGKIPIKAVSAQEKIAESAFVRAYFHGNFWGIMQADCEELRWTAQIPPEM